MTKEFWSEVDNLNIAKQRIANSKNFTSDEMLRYLNFNNKTVLDFGCGIGRNLKYLTTTSAEKIFGVDFPNMINLTKQFLIGAELGQIQFRHSLDNLPKLDIIIAILVFQHIDNIEELHNILLKMSQLLKPTGILYVHSRGYIDIGTDLNANRNVWFNIMEHFDPFTSVNGSDGTETHQRVLFKTKGDM